MNYATHFEDDLKPRLEKLAYRKSRPFCYSCYIDVTGSHCSKCGSDDNMRKLDSVGVEYGIAWIVRHIIEAELAPVDTKSEFEQSIADCYPETTTVGWLELDTITILQTQDPVSWDMAEGEWIDQQVEDGELVSFDNGTSYYRVYDIEAYLDEAEKEKQTA